MGGVIPDNTIWFALPNEHAEMFSTEVYDPFVLVPYYMGMFLGEDVRIHGKVSKRLYQNLTRYASQILDDFSDHTRKVKLIVDGFDTVSQTGNLVGASGTCGIDSLCTIYDHYANEDDLDEKISALFLFNYGSHGPMEAESTHELWMARAVRSRRASGALGLPLFLVDSNLHSFIFSMYRSDEPVGYLAMYSCVICLQKVIRKYYISTDFSYSQTLQLNESKRDFDLSEYAAPMLIPLIQTERVELIADLAQYRRSDRLARIADWEIAQKYMNICVRPHMDGGNCTTNCVKCRAAMLILESLGKTELFGEVFDVERFRAEMKKVKINTVARYYNEPLCSADAVDYVSARGMELPPYVWAALLHSPKKIKHLLGNGRKSKFADPGSNT